MLRHRKRIVGVVCALFGLLVVSAGVQARPVADPAGSTWSGNGKLKAKIQTVGKMQGQITTDLVLGPAGGLAGNRFLLVTDDSQTEFAMGGTWSVDERGRLSLDPDESAFLAEMEDLFDEVSGTPGLLDHELVSLSVKVKTKASKRGPDRITISYTARMIASHPLLERNIKWQLKGKSKGTRE